MVFSFHKSHALGHIDPSTNGCIQSFFVSTDLFKVLLRSQGLAVVGILGRTDLGSRYRPALRVGLGLLEKLSHLLHGPALGFDTIEVGERDQKCLNSKINEIVFPGWQTSAEFPREARPEGTHRLPPVQQD